MIHNYCCFLLDFDVLESQLSLFFSLALYFYVVKLNEGVDDLVDFEELF